MSLLVFAMPISLAVIAIAMIIIAYFYKEQARFGRFEIMFSFANLFILATMYLLYDGLLTAGLSYASVFLPVFYAFLWIYVLICIFMFFKLLRNLIMGIYNYKKGGMKFYE